MKIIAEVILSDDRVATIRQILTVDWLLTVNLESPASDIALIVAIVKLDGKSITESEVLNLPIEDYLLLNHTIANEMKRITQYVPIFKEV